MAAMTRSASGPLRRISDGGSLASIRKEQLMVQAFDLNVEKVLEHWTPAHALREVSANALDEHALLGRSERPEIVKDHAGVWHVRDHGRGVRYQHLTQNESDEKRASAVVVGQF